MRSEQKQHVVQVEQELEPIKGGAESRTHRHRPTVPNLGDFQAWILGAQRDALFDMNHSTGEAFGKHCDEFIQLTNAYQVFKRFMALSRG